MMMMIIIITIIETIAHITEDRHRATFLSKSPIRDLNNTVSTGNHQTV